MPKAGANATPRGFFSPRVCREPYAKGREKEGREKRRDISPDGLVWGRGKARGGIVNGGETASPIS